MKSKLLKIISIFSVFIILLCCSYSFADFSDAQKQAADINHDGKIDSKDLDLIVDQDFPPRPQDGVENPTGENYFQTTIQQQQNTYVSGEVVKVLLVGNSYTYYADLGGQLAAFANKAGKKIVVVHAVHADSGGQKLAKQNLAYACWDYSNGVGSLKTEGSTGKGIKKLKDIAKIDFANLNRAGSWDYVILQNRESGGSGAIGNKMVYEQVKNTLQSSSNFIVCSTRGPRDSARGRINAALKSAKEINCGVMITGEISVRYPNWQKVLRLNDPPDMHPSAVQQYLKAAAIYARIFGKEDLEKKVPLYNNNGKDYTEFTKKAKNAALRKGKSYHNIITKEVSIRIQDHVLKYYDKYVMNK